MIIDIPDDNLFDLTNTTSGSESSAQHSNPDGNNEHGSSMCALWCNSSIRYTDISRHSIPSWSPLAARILPPTTPSRSKLHAFYNVQEIVLAVAANLARDILMNDMTGTRLANCCGGWGSKKGKGVPIHSCETALLSTRLYRSRRDVVAQKNVKC